jgi:cobalt-zinc-cadmium efflux system protein
MTTRGFPTGSLEFPLPGRLSCADCGLALHRALSQIPGIDGATVDLVRKRVVIATENDDYDYEAVVRALGSVASGGAHEAGHAHPADEAHHGEPKIHVEHGSIDEMRTMATTNRRRLLIVLVGGSLVMAAEVIGGLVSNSLVLIADAAHYATDILAVLIAFLAVSYGLRPATRHKTFGFQRIEVIAAFLQALLLWAVSLYFVYEAVRRLRTPPDVDAPILILVGSASLVANIFLALLLRRGSETSINMRAAYLHILSDVLGSAAAVAAGVAIFAFDWHIADPILTLFVTLLLLLFTWRLTRQTLHILMEGTPARLELQDVEETLRAVPGVKEIHDLHIWTLTSGVDSLSAHVVLGEKPVDDRVAHELRLRIRNKYNVHHITVQVESPDSPCETLRHAWRTR